MPTGQLALDVTDQLDSKQLLKVLMAVKKGDFSVRMPIEYTGVAGKIADTLNDIIDLNQRMTDELARIGMVVGKEGRITQRATLGAPGGSWGACVDSVNTLFIVMDTPTTEMTRVIGAVARGDL